MVKASCRCNGVLNCFFVPVISDARDSLEIASEMKLKVEVKILVYLKREGRITFAKYKVAFSKLRL